MNEWMDIVDRTIDRQIYRTMDRWINKFNRRNVLQMCVLVQIVLISLTHALTKCQSISGVNLSEETQLKNNFSYLERLLC